MPVPGKPLTLEMLRRTDPDAVLMWNRRHQEFQLYRQIDHWHDYFVPGFGRLVVSEPVLLLEQEFGEQFYWSFPMYRQIEDGFRWDYPGFLAQWMFESDIKKRVEGDTSKVGEAIRKQRAEGERKASELWKYAHRHSRRQLERAYQPFHGE